MIAETKKVFISNCLQGVLNMIPKTIHYCWFGGKPLPELAQKCIESWKKYCPDYEIKRWDETNFDLNYNDYVREAYEAKKWAFVTDVVRLYALVNYGGIYMDTDVEVLKPLDEFLKYEAFSGFESDTYIPTGIMACEKGQKLFAELLREYDNIHFLISNGKYDETTNTIRITNTCLKYGLVQNNKPQTINGFKLFPKDYFCPKDLSTRQVYLTKNSYTIHHFDGSWMNDGEKLMIELRIKYQKYMPQKAAGYVAKFVASMKINGIRVAVNEFFSWIKRKKS